MIGCGRPPPSMLDMQWGLCKGRIEREDEVVSEAKEPLLWQTFFVQENRFCMHAYSFAFAGLKANYLGGEREKESFEILV